MFLFSPIYGFHFFPSPSEVLFYPFILQIDIVEQNPGYQAWHSSQAAKGPILHAPRIPYEHQF